MLRRVVLCVAALAVLAVSGPALAAKPSKAKSEQAAISAQYNQGVALVANRKWKAGIEMLTKVIDNPATPKDLMANALGDRGIALANSKMDAEAVADFNKALELNPNLENTYYNRARAFAKMGKHEDAVKDLTKAIELGKSNLVLASYYKNRGISYLALAKNAEAKADFQKAKQLDPKTKIPEPGKNL